MTPHHIRLYNKPNLKHPSPPAKSAIKSRPLKRAWQSPASALHVHSKDSSCRTEWLLKEFFTSWLHLTSLYSHIKNYKINCLIVAWRSRNLHHISFVFILTFFFFWLSFFFCFFFFPFFFSFFLFCFFLLFLFLPFLLSPSLCFIQHFTGGLHYTFPLITFNFW